MRLLLVLILVGMAVNWVATMLTFGLTIAGWTLFVSNLLSGELGVMDMVSAAGFRRCVLVAERDALWEWSGGLTDITAERCLALLHDQTVLVYADKQRSDRRRFARSLERLLDQAVADDAHREGATNLNASATNPPVSATSTYKPT